MKVLTVTFEIEHQKRRVTVTFEPVASKQWRVTLVADGRREVVEPQKHVSCWPCATHATSLVSRWLSSGPTIAEWAAEQAALVAGFDSDDDDGADDGWDYSLPGCDDAPEDDGEVPTLKLRSED